MKKREIFKVEGDKIVRLRRNCPKCGDGVFLAEHKDRLSCGACGYTEFKSKTQKKPVESTAEKPEIKEGTPKKQPEVKQDPPVEQPKEEQPAASESSAPSEKPQEEKKD